MLNKENGRLTAIGAEELSKIKKDEKIFKCPRCGYTKELSDIEFGAKIYCSKCTEKILLMEVF